MAWTNEETSALISIWADENVQKQLDGAARNRVVYEKISRNLSEIGFNTKSWKQCRTKIKNFIQAYRNVKDSNGCSGRGSITSEHFSAIDSVLGTRPASRPEIIISSSVNNHELDSYNSNEGLEDGDHQIEVSHVIDDESGKTTVLHCIIL